MKYTSLKACLKWYAFCPKMLSERNEVLEHNSLTLVWLALWCSYIRITVSISALKNFMLTVCNMQQ